MRRYRGSAAVAAARKEREAALEASLEGEIEAFGRLAAKACLPWIDQQWYQRHLFGPAAADSLPTVRALAAAMEAQCALSERALVLCEERESLLKDLIAMAQPCLSSSSSSSVSPPSSARRGGASAALTCTTAISSSSTAPQSAALAAASAGGRGGKGSNSNSKCSEARHAALCRKMEELDHYTDAIVALIGRWRENLTYPLPFIFRGENYLLTLRRQHGPATPLSDTAAHIRRLCRGAPYAYHSPYDAAAPQTVANHERLVLSEELPRQLAAAEAMLKLASCGLYAPVLRSPRIGRGSTSRGGDSLRSPPPAHIPIGSKVWKQRLIVCFAGARHDLLVAVNATTASSIASQFVQGSERAQTIRYFRKWIEWLAARREKGRAAAELSELSAMSHLRRRFADWRAVHGALRARSGGLARLLAASQAALVGRCMRRWFLVHKSNVLRAAVTRAACGRFFGQLHCRVLTKKWAVVSSKSASATVSVAVAVDSGAVVSSDTVANSCKPTSGGVGNGGDGRRAPQFPTAAERLATMRTDVPFLAMVVGIAKAQRDAAARERRAVGSDGGVGTEGAAAAEDYGGLEEKKPPMGDCNNVIAVATTANGEQKDAAQGADVVAAPAASGANPPSQDVTQSPVPSGVVRGSGDSNDGERPCSDNSNNKVHPSADEGSGEGAAPNGTPKLANAAEGVSDATESDKSSTHLFDLPPAADHQRQQHQQQPSCSSSSSTMAAPSKADVTGGQTRAGEEGTKAEGSAHPPYGGTRGLPFALSASASAVSRSLPHPSESMPNEAIFIPTTHAAEHAPASPATAAVEAAAPAYSAAAAAAVSDPTGYAFGDSIASFSPSSGINAGVGGDNSAGVGVNGNASAAKGEEEVEGRVEGAESAGGGEGHHSEEAPAARFPAPRPTSAARSLRVATSSHSHQAGASLGGGGERHPASAAAESASMPNEAMFVRPPPRPSSGASQRSLSHNPPTSESMANEAIFVGSAPTPPPTPALPLVSATLQHDVSLTATAVASPPPTVGMGQAMCHDDGAIDGAAGERETEPAPEGPSDADDEL